MAIDLILYMKSGNQITMDGVETYEIKTTGDTITNLHVTFSNATMMTRLSRVPVGALDLSQVEAVKEIYHYGWTTRARRWAASVFAKG